VTAVAKLVYSAITSVDGYIADDAGNFDWAMPDEEVHTFVNDLERGVGTYLYGRRMYETMRYWEAIDPVGERDPVARDFAAIWQGADKVVYSETLDAASSARTRVERAFDPNAVLRMKETAGGDLSVGGANLAGQALLAGVVDEMHLFVTPVAVGGGTPALPDHLRSDLDLLGVDRFASGVAHLHYRVAGGRL
jgi:dihydrofolate reductase